MFDCQWMGVCECRERGRVGRYVLFLKFLLRVVTKFFRDLGLLERERYT